MSKEDHSEKDPKNLQGFVVDEYRKQSEARRGTPDKDELDDEAAVKFYSRALAECQRMNGEVEKSYAKMSTLHNELGSEMFDTWRNEHSAEILSADERQAVEKAHQDVPS